MRNGAILGGMIAVFLMSASVTEGARLVGQGVDAATDWAAECLEACNREDWVSAVAPCTKAAEKGDARAQNTLGVMYYLGLSVPENDAKAVEWYTKAAEQGSALAQFNLGQNYRMGQGVSKNEFKAFTWYTKAAEHGHSMAQNNVGVMWSLGVGTRVQKSNIRAVEWFIKAAEQGDRDAQKNLCQHYRMGRGVSKDKAKAFMWCSVAVAQGNEKAASVADTLGKRLDPEQLAEAERIANEWIERFKARTETDGPLSCSRL